MKKVLFLLLACLQLQVVLAGENGPPTTARPRFSLAVWAGMRTIASADFENIYGSGKPAFGLDMGCRLGKRIEVFFAGDRLAANGELTFSKEPTQLQLTALEGGARFRVPLGRFVAAVGAGAGYYLVKEENVIGVLDEKKMGFFAMADLRLPLARRFFAALRMKFVSLKLKPFLKSIDLGGLFFGGGLGVTF